VSNYNYKEDSKGKSFNKLKIDNNPCIKHEVELRHIIFVCERNSQLSLELNQSSKYTFEELN
jgi:hypothetical protein